MSRSDRGGYLFSAGPQLSLTVNFDQKMHEHSKTEEGGDRYIRIKVRPQGKAGFLVLKRCIFFSKTLPFLFQSTALSSLKSAAFPPGSSGTSRRSRT